MDYKLTYSTMFNPPAALHERFEAALATVRGELGAVHGHFIGGADRAAEVTFELRTPIDRKVVLGRFGEATIPPSGTLLQEDDVLHVVLPADQSALLDEALHLTEGSH